MADAQDLKSCGGLLPYGFESHLGYLQRKDLRRLPRSSFNAFNGGYVARLLQTASLAAEFLPQLVTHVGRV